MIRILVVDDKQENLYMLRVLLAGNGYVVDEACHGAEALGKARRTPPQLVITDLLMPVMDGYTLLRHWKLDEKLREIPFMVYTATYTEPKDEKLALDLGADAFIIKPAEPELILSRILEVLAKQENGLPAKLPKDNGNAWIANYNDTLFRKLEKKILELEQVNQALERDISERKQADEALRESEEKFRSLFRNHSAVKFIIDPETDDIIDANEAASHFYGWTVDELCGMKISQINTLPPEKVKRKMEESLSLKDTHFEFRHRKANGCIVDVEVFSSIVYIGKKEYLHLIIHDITEKRKLESQLIQAQKMEAIGRLAGGVAHDFNNVLSVILGNTELALESLDPSDPLYNDLMNILNAAKKSAEITRQLLAFARKQTINPKVLDLNQTVEGMLMMLRHLIGEDINLSWYPGSGPCLIRADSSQIDQVLANLCVNARDAISGVGKITIETDTVCFNEDFCYDHAGYTPGNFVLLTVRDDGCGMNAETIENIFEPFFTTKDVGQGTGLGLATVYGIVKQNGGFINVFSEPQKGTTFRIYLPRHTGETVRPEIPADSSILSGRGETVLIVEDDVSILNLTKRVLETRGYTVLDVSSPVRAVDLAGKYSGKIHLLLTDIVMPEMNGRDLADRLQKIYPEMKVLYMSGYTSDIIAHRGVLDKGMFFIQKPFSVQDLTSRIRETLEGDRSLS